LDEQIQATNSLVTTLIEKIHLVSTIHDFKKKITLELLLTKDQTIALIWDTTRHLVLGGLLPFTFTNQMEYDTHKNMLQALLSHFGCRSRRLRNTSTTRSNLSNTETVGLDFESNPLIYVPKAHINMDSQDISHQRGSMNSFIAMKQLPIQSTRSFRLPLSSSSSSSSSNHQFLWIYQKYSNGMEYIAASISCSNSSNSNISNNIESSWTKLTTYR
jgi:hypothetical protein